MTYYDFTPREDDLTPGVGIAIALGLIVIITALITATVVLTIRVLGG